MAVVIPSRFAGKKATASGIRPESDLILCCARASMDPETRDRIRALLQENLDWRYVFRIALFNGMMPLLYWHLNADFSEAVPESSMTYLRSHFLWNAQQNLYLTGEVCRILKLFQASGILAVPFKGPTLACAVYGNVALRRFFDLDLLVPEHEVPKAKELLISLGYRPQLGLSGAWEAAYIRSQSAYSFYRIGDFFRRNEERIVVEVHWRVVPRCFSLELDLESLWARLKPISMGGAEIPTLSSEDLLLALCVYGAHNLWERLEWICDVAELIRMDTRMDWQAVLKQSGIPGTRRLLSLGLFLAWDLLGVDLPVEVLQVVQSDPGIKPLAAQVYGRIFHDTRGDLGVLERYRFHVRLQERLQERIRCCLRLALSPSVADWEFLPLPSSLAFLYCMARPIRLFQKYGLGLLTRVRSDLAPFVPTPPEVVERMLSLAEVGGADIIYDLGCGDGRIVIAAAKRYRACGVGVDSDPRRIAAARANARKEGVEHLVTFLKQDAKKTNLSEATVVMLYLSAQGNLMLRQRLEEQLQPGSRVVSRRYDMADWPSDRAETVEGSTGLRDILYLWQIK